MTSTEIVAVESTTRESGVVHILCCHKQSGESALCGKQVHAKADKVPSWCVVCCDLSHGVPSDCCPEDGSFCPGEGDR